MARCKRVRISELREASVARVAPDAPYILIVSMTQGGKRRGTDVRSLEFPPERLEFYHESFLDLEDVGVTF